MSLVLPVRRRSRRRRRGSSKVWNQVALKRDLHLPESLVEACMRKRRYPTVEIAERVRQRHALGDTLTTYRCDRCRGYHVGLLPGARYGRRRP